MEKFFHLKENGTTVSTEIMAGLTTFFAMSYIIIVNPQILSQTGMPWGGVFLATIIAAIIGTLGHGPVRQCSVRAGRRHGPQRVLHLHRVLRPRLQVAGNLCMVFLCGLINIIITVTKIVR